MVRSTAVVLILASGLVACGDDGAPRQPSAADASAWPSDEQIPGSDVRVGDESLGAPEGEPVEMTETEVKSWEPAAAEVDGLDPCTLVTAEEFARWAGDATPPTPQTLEDGEACGFVNAADDLRLAIGVVTIPDPDGERFVPASAGGESVSADIGIPVEALRWVANYPVEHSNVLIAETKTYDVVLEISSRGGKPQPELRDGAIEFARTAAGRIAS